MPTNSNVIGDRGESIVKVLLTRYHGRPSPFFYPQFLGEKYPTVDFLVELEGTRGVQTAFFLAQVQATRLGYNARGKLKTQFKRSKMSNLVTYPVPTYVIGVDEAREVAFIFAAVVGGSAQFSSLPTNYPLADPAILQNLYDEVLAFWNLNAVHFATSRFL